MSGVRKIQRTEHRKQMTACDELSRVEDKRQTVFCHLTSVICYLTPETKKSEKKEDKVKFI